MTKLSRRTLLGASALAVAATRVNAAPLTTTKPAAHFGEPGRVITPNGSTLAIREKNGVKIMKLVAEPVQHEFAPGLTAQCWGYNGSTPGPTIEVTEGDRVRIYVENKLPEATTVHWHGMPIPNGMDGVGGLTQFSIKPGQTFRYEFVVERAGTFMYHPHYDEMTQMALGMMGMIVVHPKKPTQKIDRDYAIMLSEWRVLAGTKRPDPNAMTDFNVLTMNSKVYPATAPLVVAKGERIRIRLGNLSAMDHHPIHIHGTSFNVVATDGGPVPASAQQPETTVLVPVGATRDIEWIASNNGDWPMHCHMTHHVMTQMGHDVENLVGVDPGNIGAAAHTMVMGQRGGGEMAEMTMPQPSNTLAMRGTQGPFGTIDMGGMFTVIKVRDVVDESTAGSDYAHPKDTVAREATAAELDEDLR